MSKRLGNLHFGSRRFAAYLGIVISALGLSYSTLAQSTLQDFPTPITSNQISGSIDARRVGDPRQTSYYYTFKGETGDVFVNVLTENFQGDIDVLMIDGLKLLTRMVILADPEPSETGRVIYLRKPEDLLVRVQGKTPNDDPAKFQIKFAGSFLALSVDEAQPVPELPRVSKPVFKDAVADENEIKQSAADLAAKADELPAADETKPEVKPGVTVEVVRTDNTGKAIELTSAPPTRERPTARQRRTNTRSRTTAANPRKTPPESAAKTAEPEKKPQPPSKEVPADPMAAFRLVVIFKDGSKIERPMTEVLRFTVDRGILTVIGKDGRIGRYSMAEIQRVGIE